MKGIYVRVSKDKQSVEQQLTVCKDLCNRRGWGYRSFRDEGVSGSISDRHGWLNLKNGCMEGKIDTIIVQRLDRITRSLKYAVAFWDWMGEHNIKVITAYEGEFVHGNPDNYFVFMLKCLLAEKERQDIIYRTNLGLDRARREGKKLGGGKLGRSWKKKNEKKN